MASLKLLSTLNYKAENVLRIRRNFRPYNASNYEPYLYELVWNYPKTNLIKIFYSAHLL